MSNPTAEVQNPPVKQRESNLELFRIITMLLIVAHHFVVNSGLMDADGVIASDPLSANSVFLLLFGAWGKTGINCFVLITGYFMCKSDISAKKFAKLFLEVLFYRFVFYAVFLITGYENISMMRIVRLLIPVSQIEHNFTGCFLVFFLFIPFLNLLVHHMTERMHFCLLLLLSVTYILLGTVKSGSFGVLMNYTSWFMVLYFIASYIRLYPKNWFSNNRLCGVMLLLFLMLSVLSVLGCLWLGRKTNQFMPYYFVTDSNTFLAVMTGLFAFLFFKNLRIPYSRLINAVAASTFGVFLIHTNSEAMRQWLWKDTLDNVGHFTDPYLPLYAIGCVLAVFAVCALIDCIRIHLFEKPFFKWWDKHWERFSHCFKAKEDAFFRKFHIE